MAGWLEKIMEKLTQSKQSGKGKLTLTQWLIIVVCVGLALMIFNNFRGFQQEVNQQAIPTLAQDQSDVETEEAFSHSRSSPQTMREYEEFYENKLKDILSKIVGVGDLYVMVNLDSTEEIVVQVDVNTQQSTTREQDREGGSRNIEDISRNTQTVITRNGNNDEPIILMTKKPKVRGVVVVASGADNMQVKTWIIEAIQRSLDVPINNISVLPKK